MKVIVVGGGIAGLSTAVALQQRGIETQVYESAYEIASVGKGIWVPTNAMLVLDRLGLGDSVEARGLRLDRIEVRDKSAGVLQSIDLKGVRARFGRSTVSILRANLQFVLAEALQAGTLHLGKRCVGTKQTERSAIAVFADDTTATGDVLVGADGIHSVCRQSINPDSGPRYAGQTCYLGLAQYEMPPDLARTVWEVWGGSHRFGFSALSGTRVYWFAPITQPEASRRSDAFSQAALRDQYADFPGVIPDLIEHTPTSEILQVDLHDLPPMKEWSLGRVVLVGDAAHAMTPNLGQGGAQSIEDAYVLAKVLAVEDNLESAFAAYARLRQPKMNRIARTAWRLGQLAHVEARCASHLRNVLMRSTPERIGQRQAKALYALNY